MKKPKDNDPVTHEWLDSLAQRQSSGDHNVWVIAATDLLVILITDRWNEYQIVIHSRSVLEGNLTCGQVRKWCDLVGSPLAE